MELAELGKVKSEFESAARSFQTEVQSKGRRGRARDPRGAGGH
jgi:hypothetical protein